MNLVKTDKGTTAILDTAQKIEEGLQQLSNDRFYKPLPSPIVQETARKAKELVTKPYRSGHIDLIMTHAQTVNNIHLMHGPEGNS